MGYSVLTIIMVILFCLAALVYLAKEFIKLNLLIFQLLMKEEIKEELLEELKKGK